MKNKTKNILFTVIILWQLLIWFEFVPTNYADPWTDPYLGPAADLAPGFYYVLGIPVGLLGIFLFFSTIGKHLELTRGEKILIWVLLIVSVCTAVPPLFAIARYIFYPLVNILGG